MAKSRRSGQGIDIHHPKMVKTVFILTSLAILAFLALIVKTTSFKSEPKAAEAAMVFSSNGVSCRKTYPDRAYAFCERSCGGKRLTFKGFVDTVATGTICGTYSTKPNIFPNYSPLDKNSVSKVWNRPKTIHKSYCCVSN